MGLQLEEIRELVKSPTKANIISKAVRHESRLRFHVESSMDSSEVSQPVTVFLDWVKGLIPKDKYRIFVSLFQYPTPTVPLSNTIFRELERVFDGRNPSANYEFLDSELLQDWEQYKEANLSDSDIWRKKGWEAVKTGINSVMVVDLPTEQTSERPEPYFYFLGIENVIDYRYQDGVLQYLIFKQDGNRIAVFDDTYYRVFQLDKDNNITSDYSESEHGLGFCPARFFWSTELSQKTPELKASPISSQLANLDWLLFFSISKRHLDLYAPYPIYSAYAADCDFENGETGDYCDGGYLRDSQDQYRVQRDGVVQSCPVCTDKRLAGVGSFIEVPVPTKDDPDLRNPVTITTIDKSSLDYNVDEVKRLASEVFNSVVGVGGDIEQKQSINEMQVQSNFESKVSVLNSLKSNLEAAKKFVADTCCKLRYGDSFVGSSINMGTEFYIHSVSDLYNQYKQAKENGSSESELDAINEQIIATEHRNNPASMRRMLVLKQLEPYRHYTFSELMTLESKSLLDAEMLQIKINFNTFISRFERENTNIVEFASQLELDQKIKIITQKLKDYAREQNLSENAI